jgi:hypothetical protein
MRVGSPSCSSRSERRLVIPEGIDATDLLPDAVSVAQKATDDQPLTLPISCKLTAKVATYDCDRSSEDNRLKNEINKK